MHNNIVTTSSMLLTEVILTEFNTSKKECIHELANSSHDDANSQIIANGAHQYIYSTYR